ncbi:MAG: RimK family alpha-L-glutamate ligase [Actinomycetota bacterium]
MKQSAQSTSGERVDVALATYSKLPSLDDDERLLIPALAARGLSARPVVWDDPKFDWGNVRLVVVRSTWDYHHRRTEFLNWATVVAARVPFWNPPATLRWNTHKTYLRDLENRGIAVVPTEWLPAGSAAALDEVMDKWAWKEVVVKPTVSADGYRTLRVSEENLALGESHLRALVADREVMVQPFMGAVQTEGEHCAVIIAGELTHGLRKMTIFQPGFVDAPTRFELAADEQTLAHDAVAAAGYEYLYARIDLVRDESGRPHVMELEMTEPSLYFKDALHAADRLADRIVQLLD